MAKFEGMQVGDAWCATAREAAAKSGKPLRTIYNQAARARRAPSRPAGATPKYVNFVFEGRRHADVRACSNFTGLSETTIRARLARNQGEDQ